MKKVILTIACVVCLAACSPPFSGGATYLYKYRTPDGKTIDMEVKSTREIDEGVEVNIDPETGKVNVVTGAVTNGPNNTQAFINALVNAFLVAMKSVAVTPK